MENGNGKNLASTWRVGYLLEFPSGNQAYVRPVSVVALLSAKNIPDPLMKVVQEWIDGPMANSEEMTEADIESKLGGRTEVYRNQRQIYEAYAFAAMVNPRVVIDPQKDDEISIMDMSHEDMEYLFNFLGRTATELKMFSRRQQDTSLEPVLDVQEFFAETKRNGAGELAVSTTDRDG